MKRKIVCLLLTCTIVLSGCTKSSVPSGDTNKEPKTEQTTQDTENSEVSSDTNDNDTESVFGINEEVTLNDWAITVTNVSVAKEIPNGEYLNFTADDGNKYLVLDVTVTNNGNDSNTFMPSVGFGDAISVKLYYQSDYEYSSTNLLGLSDELHDTTLNPLSTKSGIVAFELPDSVADSTEELIFRVKSGRNSVDFKVR